MSTLTLNLTKPGDTAKKLSLNLTKDEKFVVKLAWEGDADLDLHALLCINDGQTSQVSSFDDILSPYNIKRKIGGQIVGTLEKAPDGSFQIYGGALVHSPDATTGDDADVDEFIEFNPSKLTLPAGAAYEVPLVAMIHPQSSGKTFKDIKNAKVTVEDANGTVLMSANLSNQFGEFVGVQMGSIMMESSGTSFAQVGVGFNEDFNGVLGHFS